MGNNFFEEKEIELILDCLNIGLNVVHNGMEERAEIENLINKIKDGKKSILNQASQQ